MMNSRRLRRAAGAAGDEAAESGYFASVSDLMVGVLFLFLLMLTVFALNYRDAEQAQTVERKVYEQALHDLEQQQTLARTALAEAERQAANVRHEAAENERLRGLLRRATGQMQQDVSDRAAARMRLLIALQRAMREQHIEVSLDPAAGILRLPADVLFPTGSATLEPKARAVVQTLARVLTTILPCNSPASAGCLNSRMILETVLVEGHTDRQRFQGLDAAASQDRNDHLSAERALAVFLELRRSQPVLDQVRNNAMVPLIGVSGYGERRPRAEAACSAEADCPANRRIDLRFVLSAQASDEVRHVLGEIDEVLKAAP
jgi:chemotaxis protein MotB